MKYKKRLLSLMMSAIMIFGSAFGLAACNKDDTNNETTSGEETTTEQSTTGEQTTTDDTKTGDKPNGENKYGLAKRAQDGAILHAWCWSFETIINSLDDIAAAGYTSIQTSPINECVVGGGGGMQLFGEGKWYYQYQPTDWKIGNYQLGTRDEFKALCEAADQYGIKIIVDVAPNHTTTDESAISKDFIDAVGGMDKMFHKNGREGIEKWGDRAECTLQAMGGLPDVDTENPAFQDYFIEFLNDCIDLGADGFRYDTAKHIGLSDDPQDDPDKPNNFWERVITEVNNADQIFNYGEVLQGDNDRIASYIDVIGAATASEYSGFVRSSGKAQRFVLDKLQDFSNVGGSKNVVTWVESHDNYTGEGTNKHIDDTAIKMAWAFITARKDGTPLFFSRPYGANATSPWGTINYIGASGSYLYKDPSIAAVNKFRNAMVGEDEKMFYPSEGFESSVLIERGTKGLVIINADAGYELDCETALADGTYIDRVAGAEFTVSGGKISGTIKEQSIIVLCNDGYIESPATAVVSIEDTEGVYYDDVKEVVLKVTGADKAEYSIDGSDPKEYKDGDKIVVVEGADTETFTKLTLSAESEDGLKTVMTYVFYKKKAMQEGTKIYFKVPETWGNVKDIYAYVYDEVTSTEVKRNNDWPGKKMTDEGDGLYSYTLEEDWQIGLIIFNDGPASQQAPGANEPGFVLEADKTYEVE